MKRIRSDREEQHYDGIDLEKLQEQGINATDIKKMKEHGIHTVAGVLMVRADRAEPQPCLRSVELEECNRSRVHQFFSIAYAFNARNKSSLYAGS